MKNIGIRMIGKLLFILFVFFNLNFIFSQKSETENLVNIFSKDIIPKDFKYYNLLDESLNQEFDVDYLNEFMIDSEVNKMISLFTKDDFKNIKNDVNWSKFHLENARVYSYERIPKFRSPLYHRIFLDKKMNKKHIDSVIAEKKYYQIIILGNSKWSDEKIKRKFQKEFEYRNKKIKKEDQDFYAISNPIFSVDKKFAIIYYSTCCSTSGYLYYCSNDKWEQYFKFYTSIIN